MVMKLIIAVSTDLVYLQGHPSEPPSGEAVFETSRVSVDWADMGAGQRIAAAAACYCTERELIYRADREAADVSMIFV